MMESEKIKGVIFDLDGTLVDSLDDIAESANRVLALYGIAQYSVDSYRHFVGNGLHTLMRRIMPEETTESALDSCAESFKKFYSANWNNNTAPYPGICRMLKTLLSHGIKIAVLSNKPDDFTRMCAEEFFSAYDLSFVYGQRDGIPPKPHPQAALEIAEKLLLPPTSCMFVGDTSVDMKTGKNAGMFSVGVTWGFRDIQELKEAGADRIATHPDKLVTYAITHH